MKGGPPPRGRYQKQYRDREQDADSTSSSASSTYGDLKLLGPLWAGPPPFADFPLSAALRLEDELDADGEDLLCGTKFEVLVV